ncbi:hypothetical protein [Piscirickettsia litoralis]|uniref:hypothetical protein n=1 Tax=Piscirickettsia litoralis TaxID=1891921 RepID=UPI001F384010|nr:hypothetical protein [Piscirickettsia litoralis]
MTEKVIFGILSAFACYDRISAERAARVVSLSARKENLNCNLALQLFEKYKDRKIYRILYNHTIIFILFFLHC